MGASAYLVWPERWAQTPMLNCYLLPCAQSLLADKIRVHYVTAVGMVVMVIQAIEVSCKLLVIPLWQAHGGWQVRVAGEGANTPL